MSFIPAHFYFLKNIFSFLFKQTNNIFCKTSFNFSKTVLTDQNEAKQKQHWNFFVWEAPKSEFYLWKNKNKN